MAENKLHSAELRSQIEQAQLKPTHAIDWDSFSKATPDQKADVLSNMAHQAKSGDAPKQQILANYVNDLRRSEDLDVVANSLQERKEANVIRGRDGEIKELLFDPKSKQPVDVKVHPDDASVDGHSKQEIDAATRDYTKAYLAERVKNDASLSPAAKQHVIAIESAFVDTDGKKVIDAVKNIDGGDKTANEVAHRLHADMPPAAFSWTSSKSGSHAMNIQDFGGSKTQIPTDYSPTSVTSNVYGVKDGTPIDPVKALSKLGEKFSDLKPIEIDMVRSNLDSLHRIDGSKKISAEKLADKQAAWEKGLRHDK